MPDTFKVPRTQVVTSPLPMLRPRRKITGISATLLPFTEEGRIDWAGFCAHLERTVTAGLIPAVNMDTGYVNLLDDNQRRSVLAHAREVLSGKDFIAGAFVADHPGDHWNPDAYRRELDTIQHHGAVPVVFQSYGLTDQDSDRIISAYAELGRDCARFIAFELGQMFAPFGRIYDPKTYKGLLSIHQCIGAKHSSLSRGLEWQRLILRDQLRPDFKVFTGNDLGIDMVMYGSDYLLGLCTFAPDFFARRDQLWESGDTAFYELNDILQYLGFFTFRAPVPAYKHSAAQFLKLRGWLSSDSTHPASPGRPAGDIAVLKDILERLNKTGRA